MSHLSQEQQEAELPKLVEFLSNPWFQHFKQAQLDELERCMAVILSPEINPQNTTIREQIIGEARAYKICSEYPEIIHIRVTRQKERKQNEKTTDNDVL